MKVIDLIIMIGVVVNCIINVIRYIEEKNEQ
jgi:hypothetical protein